MAKQPYFASKTVSHEPSRPVHLRPKGNFEQPATREFAATANAPAISSGQSARESTSPFGSDIFDDSHNGRTPEADKNKTPTARQHRPAYCVSSFTLATTSFGVAIS